MSGRKETKLAKKLRARAGADGLSPDHPLYISAAALDTAAAKAFGPDAPAGAHAAFTAAEKDAHALFRRYRQGSRR